MKRLGYFILFLLSFATCFGQQKLNREEYKAAVERIKEDTLPYLVQRLPDAINSPFSEYNPHLYRDSIFFFTSMKSEVGEDNDQIFDWHWSSKIYSSKYLNGKYNDIKSLARIINKSNYYHPNFCFDKSHKRIIFSRCIRTEYEELVCHLYESHQDKGKWMKPQRLGNEINNNSFSSTQPYLAELGNYDVLYFVSNNPKGRGGMDIWFSIYKDGKYGEAINAGSNINTSGNEVCPFYDTEEKTLYFSSDEWIGIGGYDIFKSEGGLSSWKTPNNLGIPINSSENDIYFCINDDKSSGFLSSNRPLDPAHLEDTCCNDIFLWKRYNNNESTNERTVNQTCLSSVERGGENRAKRGNENIKPTNLIAFSLYFDNDSPDTKSISDTSKSHYLELLSEYKKKTELFLSKNKKNEDSLAIKHFFTDSLELCEQNLALLIKNLQNSLSKGDSVTIYVNGYASALHNQKYNIHLSRRRIASFVNEIKESKHGLFLPYIQNKQLIIEESPIGSSEAKNKSTNPIYSFGACIDRRIDVSMQIKQ